MAIKRVLFFAGCSVAVLVAALYQSRQIASACSLMCVAADDLAGPAVNCTGNPEFTFKFEVGAGMNCNGFVVALWDYESTGSDNVATSSISYSPSSASLSFNASMEKLYDSFITVTGSGDAIDCADPVTVVTTVTLRHLFTDPIEERETSVTNTIDGDPTP